MAQPVACVYDRCHSNDLALASDDIVVEGEEGKHNVE